LANVNPASLLSATNQTPPLLSVLVSPKRMPDAAVELPP
jgi:hypothetical protein